jgi:hypothetical protein
MTCFRNFAIAYRNLRENRSDLIGPFQNMIDEQVALKFSESPPAVQAYEHRL